MSTIITITINNIMDDSHPSCIIILLLITNIINIIIIQNWYSSFLFLFYIYVISIFSPLHQRCVVVARRQESASEIFSRTW
jgi:hypothetical protein